MRVLAEPATEDLFFLRRGQVARAGWMLLGLVLVGIGLIGLFVPLLPATDFMLLALPCFARSSPRLEAWLLNHPRFGPALQAWQRERAVPRRAKTMAWIGMALGYALFWLHVRPDWLRSIGVAAFMLFWATWIGCRPEPETEG